MPRTAWCAPCAAPTANATTTGDGRPEAAARPQSTLCFEWTDTEGLRAPVRLSLRLATDGAAVLDCTLIEAGLRDEIKVEHFYPPTFVALPPRRPAAPARPLPEWAAELLELIGKHLDLPSFIAFHATCRAVHDKTLTLQAHLLELSQVTQVVSRELERLRDPARRTQAPPWTAQELQRVTAAFDDPLIRGTPAAHDVMQRGLGRALHRWAGQLASNLLLHRVPLAVALPQMLQQAGHLPDAVLAMAAPRLVQIFAMAPALLASMAGFVDALYTLDRQRPQPPGCAAADLAAGLSAAAGSDAANQQLVHAFLQDAAQRPPVFEATALTWLLWAVAHVGPPEDTQDPLLPPAQRRTELYDDIVARYRLLPDDLKPGPRRWLEDRIRLLPRVDRARREAHLATL
jgi:hypothetical protein